jgi:hypothetical protein
MSLCGDTAHLHKKVLPEVVLGEFHVTVRAPSQPRRKRKAEIPGNASNVRRVVIRVVGRQQKAKKKKKRFKKVSGRSVRSR